MQIKILLTYELIKIYPYQKQLIKNETKLLTNMLQIQIFICI